MDLPLAAYGTLLPGCGGADYLGIGDRLEDLGPCTLPGRLWLTREMVVPTDEPRLVPAYYPEEEGIVCAHLFRVPEDVWGEIDAFEDFRAHDPDSSYLREEIKTLEGESVWVYRAQKVERINRLRDGDWRRYAYHPKSIALFPSQENPFQKNQKNAL